MYLECRETKPNTVPVTVTEEELSINVVGV